MERKKLIFNVMRDIWNIANEEYANKHKSDMCDQDWDDLLNKFHDYGKKYDKLREEERTFYHEIASAFMSLIEREGLSSINITQEHTSTNYTIWVTPEEAKDKYGIIIPNENNRKQP